MTWQFKFAGLFTLALLAMSAWGQSSADIAKELAPTGTLRVVINLGNPILARQDSASVSPVGVSVDLAQALATKFNLPITLMPVASAGQSVALVTEGQADLGFFAIDPVRGKGISFTPAYVLIEGSYLVKNNSPLTDKAQVDQAQHRVVVGKGSAYDLFLTRELKAAQLVRAPTSPQVVPMFVEGTFDVAAGVKQQLESDAKKFDGLRLLPGNFMVIHQAMGQPNAASPLARQALAEFITEMKLSGFVRASLTKHRIEGATVAP